MVRDILLMRRFLRLELRRLWGMGKGLGRLMRKGFRMLKGWRTLFFSVLLASLGVLEATDWARLIPDGPAKGWWLLGIALIIAWLRAVTTTPIGRSE